MLHSQQPLNAKLIQCLRQTPIGGRWRCKCCPAIANMWPHILQTTTIKYYTKCPDGRISSGGGDGSIRPKRQCASNATAKPKPRSRKTTAETAHTLTITSDLRLIRIYVYWLVRWTDRLDSIFSHAHRERIQCVW